MDICKIENWHNSFKYLSGASNAEHIMNNYASIAKKEYRNWKYLPCMDEWMDLLVGTGVATIKVQRPSP